MQSGIARFHNKSTMADRRRRNPACGGRPKGILMNMREGMRRFGNCNNIDYEAVSQRLQRIVESRGERVLEFKSRKDVVNHVRRRWRNTFEDVIEVGSLLILNDFVARDFPRRKPACDEDTQFLQLSYHTARRLMMIAQSERINNPVDRAYMSDSWYILYLIAGMPKSMYEKGKATGVIHRTCTERDIISFMRYERGLSFGEKIIIHVCDKSLCGGAEFVELQDRFEELRNGLIEFIERHRNSEEWGGIVTGVQVKKRLRLPRMG